MKVSDSILFALVLLSVVGSLVDARISCIRCESSNNEECGAEMNEEQLDKATRECDDIGEDICMKTRVRAMRTSWTAKNGRLEVATTKISRFCGKSTNYPWTGCWEKNGKAGDSIVCACTSDNCNASSVVTLSGLVLVTGLVVSSWLAL